MSKAKTRAALGAAATAAVLAVSTATVASATTTQGFGSQERLNEANGAVVTGYTVSGIMPSSDVIPYPVSGRLYESTLTVDAVQGSVTPLIPLFNARAQNGDTYRVLANVATPQGVSPATLQQGGRSTGKIYFDVVGAVPNSVVYTNGADDLLLWVGGSGGTGAAGVTPPAGGSAGTNGAASGAGGASSGGSTGAGPSSGGATGPAGPQGGSATSGGSGNGGTGGNSTNQIGPNNSGGAPGATGPVSGSGNAGSNG